MTLVIKPNKTQALDARTQLALLRLPAPKRTRILKTLGRYERTLARKRITTQTTLENSRFAPRKSGKKTKMLRRMGKTLEPYVKNANRLELRHKASLTGSIAALQQDGGKEIMTARKMARKKGTPDYEGPCTEKQAAALRKQGYKIRKAKGRGYRRAGKREIMDSLTLGQAGLVLRMMRGKESKQRWDIPVPARSFLGDKTENVQRQLVRIIEQINKTQRG